MERYGDEDFIQFLRQSQEAARNRDIKKGSVWADGRNIVFSEREILKKQFWIWMPDDFVRMSQEMARLKYPNESRPEIIYTSEDSTLNITFSKKLQSLEPGQEEQVRDDIKLLIQRLYPSGSIIESLTVQADDNRLAWFDFISPAIDMDVYNLMFFTSLKGKLLMGSCNCLSGEQDMWKDLFLQMLASVRVEGQAVS